MAWNRNDWIAAALITGIAVMAFLAAAYLLGWIPSVDDVIPFKA